MIDLTQPFPQDPAYHAFADQRAWLDVPNFQNVASNLPFLIVGFAGLWAMRRAAPGRENAAWVGLFLGVALTALGSSYYHWSPTNATLLWDRLPMALAFMALFAAIIGERVSERLYRLLLAPLIASGFASVIYWYVTETAGSGDLRPYIVVQFFPLLAIPVIIALRPAKYTHTSYVFYALGFYLSAKALEVFDQQVFALLGETVSGHALKHVAAALGCFFLYLMWVRRKPVRFASHAV